MSKLKIKATVLPDLKSKIQGTVSRGIKSIYVNEENRLIFVLTDDSEIDVGAIVASSKKIKEVTLLASKWEGTESPYTQEVVIEGTTPLSEVTLKPNAEQLESFRDKELALHIENHGGTLIAYATGDKPLNDYTIQVGITEVVYD